MPGTLIVEGDGPVVVLTISNPQKRNALDPPLCDALVAAFQGLPRSARAAVLRGDPAGRAFSAGFDLDALGSDDPAASEKVFTRVLDSMAASAVPIVAALGGAAIGGGCEVAAACDVRIAHAGVKLGLPPARLGLVYAARGLARFSALCGESRARQLFLFARTVTATEAAGWGLVDEVVEAGDVEARASAVAAEVAALVPLAVQGMRMTFEALLRRRATLEGPEAEEIARRRAEAWRSMARGPGGS